MWAWTWQVHSGSGKKRTVGQTSSATDRCRPWPQYLLAWSKRRRTDGTTKIEASKQNRSGIKKIPLCTKAISTEPMPDFGDLRRQWWRLYRSEIFSGTQTDQLTNELYAALIIVDQCLIGFHIKIWASLCHLFLHWYQGPSDITCIRHYELSWNTIWL